tara:strand:+ start:391 stop:999 length:609 start_codon:yes stop_codon:yes gene_type:complete
MTYPLIKPGELEIYCGPMRSGKTRELINRVDRIRYVDGSPLGLFKPSIDTRHEGIHTRFGNVSYECGVVDVETPSKFLEMVSGLQVVGIDEAHFFNEDVVDVVEELLRRDSNVVMAGLDLDFRGEPFGVMPTLLAMADYVQKLKGVCEYDGCSSLSSRTQRLLDGKPANYNEPIILVGDRNEGYFSRCLKHHEVPGRPNSLE